MDELFPAWRYHAVFTDSPFGLVQAEGQHRDHAVVEQVFADVTSGPLAHMPSVISAALRLSLMCATGLLSAVSLVEDVVICSSNHADDRGMDPPRDFRTAYLWLIHAADCRSRYSSWTCCGVRY